MPLTEQEVLIYCTTKGKEPFCIWLEDVPNDVKQIIHARITRIRLSNFGDVKSIGAGVFEVRIAYGPGYRIYFARKSAVQIILLCAGTKRTQKKDILSAKLFWYDFKTRIGRNES